MARVTVEDCIRTIPNRFELVITAAQRAKQISSGVPLTVDRDNDKDSVVSLREIADETIDLDQVREEMVQSFQRQQGFDPHDRIEDDAPSASDSKDAASEAFAEAQAQAPEGAAEEQSEGAGFAGGLSFIEDNVEVDD
ncbi:MAG: DNA-directed RNA polymerase subunit omega [Rickettsiales bacterium]|nr:DNA-directed RNA polymerase subunit omega [Rickettsiales bacterium]